MQSKRVAQAAGMVSVQANCTPNQALVLMTDRASMTGRRVEEIAQAVVDRVMRFDTSSA